ncbi:hypothetical protein [Corallococcus silvisoli]|uniref:hypothetical protein n=1 Tax=Corallococcus silvisoli TaxID=2697031 RepID=UPI0013789699|nr:hypothetical protein [Corallococcus silvisoli]NBD11858.1 hypothetical protein [Corallococcus silvisoli]
MLFRTPDERDMWLPVAVFSECDEPENSPHGTVYPTRLVVRRDFMAQHWPNLLAKLEAGVPVRAAPVKPRLVLAESSVARLVLEFRDVLDASRLEFGGAAVVLGLTTRQVLKLWEGYLRVESDEEMAKVEAAFRAELERQSKVAGVPVTEGIYWRNTEG